MLISGWLSVIDVFSLWLPVYGNKHRSKSDSILLFACNFSLRAGLPSSRTKVKCLSCAVGNLIGEIISGRSQSFLRIVFGLVKVKSRANNNGLQSFELTTLNSNLQNILAAGPCTYSCTCTCTCPCSCFMPPTPFEV